MLRHSLEWLSHWLSCCNVFTLRVTWFSFKMLLYLNTTPNLIIQENMGKNIMAFAYSQRMESVWKRNLKEKITKAKPDRQDCSELECCLHSVSLWDKENSQKVEKATYRMGKCICQLYKLKRFSKPLF